MDRLPVYLWFLVALFLWVDLWAKGRNRDKEEGRAAERHAEMMEKLEALRETVQHAADAEKAREDDDAYYRRLLSEGWHPDNALALVESRQERWEK